MKILITGASGFVGKKVLERLLPNNDVIALSSQTLDGVTSIPSLNYRFDNNYLRNNG